MEKIKKIAKRMLTKEVILYVIFGILTTVVNLGLFYLFYAIWNWDKNISNLLAIIIAVLFAYVTNKNLVFHSQAKTIKEKSEEFVKFIAGRAFTMLVEFLGGLFLFETRIPEMISKAFLTIIVIILNFFISKFFAFRSKKKEVK